MKLYPRFVDHRLTKTKRAKPLRLLLVLGGFPEVAGIAMNQFRRRGRRPSNLGQVQSPFLRQATPHRGGAETAERNLAFRTPDDCSGRLPDRGWHMPQRLHRWSLGRANRSEPGRSE